MAGLLEKVRILTGANLHALVNEALQRNSPAVMDEYVRQVEDNLAELEDAAATMGGEVKALQRKYEEHANQVVALDHNIDLLLLEGKEDLAAAAQSKLNAMQRLADRYHQQHEQQQGEYQQLLDARLKLEAKLSSVRQQRDEMQALLELARSKELTSKTLRSLDTLTGAGDQDVARMAQNIQARLDKANARAELQGSRLDTQLDDMLERRALDTQMAERKLRLGLSRKD